MCMSTWSASPYDIICKSWPRAARPAPDTNKTSHHGNRRRPLWKPNNVGGGGSGLKGQLPDHLIYHAHTPDSRFQTRHHTFSGFRSNRPRPVQGLTIVTSQWKKTPPATRSTMSTQNTEAQRKFSLLVVTCGLYRFVYCRRKWVTYILTMVLPHKFLKNLTTLLL